ncbi:2,4-dichlorophenol 6-monooxygenase [compost metagenome]
MTRSYESKAVISDGTPRRANARDPELFFEAGTRPGSVVPHVWLVQRHASPLVSTLDVVGKGAFCLLVGHNAQHWREVTLSIANSLKIEIGVVSIGAGLDYEDPYGSWAAIREVEDDGCILVRPDLIVGWRSLSFPVDAEQALLGVMSQILGWI